MMAPKMFLTTVPKCLGGGSSNLVTFNINICIIKKVIKIPVNTKFQQNQSEVWEL